jgi:uncharacterized membrane protein
MSDDEPVYCGVCGTLAATGAPPTWSMQTSERGLQMLCDECTRTNIRSIEGRLDEAWW